MSKAIPLEPEDVFWVFLTTSSPDAMDPDLDWFSDNHLPLSPALKLLRQSGSESFALVSFTRIWGMLTAAEARLLIVGALVFKLV